MYFHSYHYADQYEVNTFLFLLFISKFLSTKKHMHDYDYQKYRQQLNLFQNNKKILITYILAIFTHHSPQQKQKYLPILHHFLAFDDKRYLSKKAPKADVHYHENTKSNYFKNFMLNRINHNLTSFHFGYKTSPLNSNQ